MIPYFFIFFIFLFFYFFKNEKDDSEIFPFVFCTIALSCFIGFRDMIGGFDVFIYGELYESDNAIIMQYLPFETGFKYYYLLLRLFSENRYFMFFITALITISFHFAILKKYSESVFIAIFIYFCKFTLMDFVYLRQGLAMCFVWISIDFVLKRKLIWFLTLVFLAFNFHRSALLFVPIYFIYNVKFNNVSMFITLLVTFTIAISPLGNILFGFLAETSDNDKLSLYVSRNNDVNIFYFIEIILISILGFNFKDKFYQTEIGTFFFNGMVIYILVSTLALTNPTFVRFGWYFFVFIIVGITYIYSFIDDVKQKNIFKTLTFLYFTLLFFRLVIILDGGDYMPYKTFFQDFDRQGQFDWMEYR